MLLLNRSFRQACGVIIVTLLFLLWFLRGFRSPLTHSNLDYGILQETSAASRLAIATFLTGDNVYYFDSTRILTYQLLHAPETRCNRTIPFLVLVTSNVPDVNRQQLASKGATVVPVEDVPLTWWIKTGVERWKDQFTKLRLLEMVDYDRILFIDADTILTRPVDGIFDEPAARTPSRTNFDRKQEIKDDEAQLPTHYVFCARSNNELTGRRDHQFPPLSAEFFSAGFWLAAPSRELFAYLLSVMEHLHRFDPFTMEQSLLNYAFRRDGAMPWVDFDYMWSATWPNLKDFEGGVATLHEKFGMDRGPETLQQLWREWKRRADEYFSQP